MPVCPEKRNRETHFHLPQRGMVRVRQARTLVSLVQVGDLVSVFTILWGNQPSNLVIFTIPVTRKMQPVPFSGIKDFVTSGYVLSLSFLVLSKLS